MWLVLCSHDDLSAVWVFDGMRKRGLFPLALVTADQLTPSLRWAHRVSVKGASIEVHLADGRRLHSDTTRGVLNRLSVVPTTHFRRATATDRDYAAQEFTAFFMSWLQSLQGPMLNRPTPHGLSGGWRHPSEWLCLASQVGLQTPTYRQLSFNGAGTMEYAGIPFSREGPVKTVFVVEQQVVGEQAPEDVMEGCRRLAKLCGYSLLAVEFVILGAGRWICAGASTMPDLRLGGEKLLDALTSVMRRER
jgi:hypothetical protein